MAPSTNWSKRMKSPAGSGGAERAAVLDLLRHRYVSEKQQGMRYRQHAERIHDAQFSAALREIAAEEQQHAQALGAKLIELGEVLPEVIPIHAAKEQNSWLYLRTDLAEERRCSGELDESLPPLGGEFCEIAELLERIAADGRRHRAKLRAMMARSDPQSAGPP